MKDLKDHTVPISISTLTSLGAAVSIVWFLIQPVMVAQVSNEISDTIDDKIDKQQRPIESAFKALLRQNIATTRRAIAMLEYRRDHQPETWTQENARLLEDRKLELQALQEAYAEL